MDLTPTALSRRLQTEVADILRTEVLPRHADYVASVRDGEHEPAFLSQLRTSAKAAGLWNLAQPDLGPGDPGQRLSNLEFAPICELLGRIPWASAVFNCQAPDVPNAGGLLPFVTPLQHERFLLPLLEGEVRSAFAMTEPAVASSDATNLQTTIVRRGDKFIVNGHKWYITGAAHPECAFHLTLGVTEPDAAAHRRQSCVIIPADTPGVRVSRENRYIGLTDTIAPIGEVHYDDVEIPVEYLLGEEGAGFVVGQVRLGPARLHHCMRLVGAAEAMIEMMRKRAGEREVFGRSLDQYDANTEAIARSRVEVQQARLLLLALAWELDNGGARAARQSLSVAKVAVSEMAHRVANRAVHLYGAKGLSDDTPLAGWLGYAHMFLVGDGPTETHLRQIYRLEPEPSFPVAEYLDLSFDG